MKRLIRFITKSLTVRLTLSFAVVATVMLLLINMAAVYSINHFFELQSMNVLTGQMERLRTAFQDVRTEEDLQHLLMQRSSASGSYAGKVVAIVGPDEEVSFLGRVVNLPPALLTQSAALSQQASFADALVWEDDNTRFRGVAGTLQTSYAGWPKGRAIVAVDISFYEQCLAKFRLFMWLIILASCVVMCVLGWVVTRQGLMPLRKLGRVASEVTATKLDQRLPIDNVPYELDEPTRTLNDMLARLEASFKRMSDFSSDLAHELRTPINNLMTQTQVSLSRARTAEEYREILYSNAEELERMARMVSDMLFLAKADNDLAASGGETVKLEEEVEQLFEFYEALAEVESVRLVVQGSGAIRGDRSMLRRAVSNLLSNAINHSRKGSDVRVRISRKDNALMVLSVENDGDPISCEHLPRLFDRFYRVDSSRQSPCEGGGLGLAITRSIIEAHRGKITVSSENGVTRFTIALPATEPDGRDREGMRYA